MSKEFGSIGMNSSATSTATAERAGTRTTGITETKSTNKNSYQPVFSISKEGNLSRGGDSMKKTTSLDRKGATLTPFKGEASYFSLDKVAPKESARFETILYQKVASEKPAVISPEKRQYSIPELKNKITVSDKDGKVTPSATEVLYKRPENTPTEGKVASPTTHIESPAKKPAWITKQSQLTEQRAPKDQPVVKIASERPTDKNINPFTSKLQQRVAAVQSMQTRQNMNTNITPSRLHDLEVKVKKDLRIQSSSYTPENTPLVELIQKTATPEVGKIHLTYQKEVNRSLTTEQAHLEIATKLKDGAKVASNMIKILESQGTEPQLARKLAVEKVTQTLVKTIKEKQLDQFLRNDEEQPRVDTHTTQTETQPKIEVKEYVDAQGHQIREKITTDEFDVRTIEREEIIAERDVIADANRIEMATHIGSQLLDKAHRGGSTSIHTREVVELMPEEPGEALASFIRTQLGLLLDNEEQYDFFKDALATAGYVATEYDVTRAAKYATDLAPAVRLTRKLTTEKVFQRDEERAISRGKNFSLN